jgi:hypothetical protein
MSVYEVAHSPSENAARWTREEFPTRDRAFDAARTLKRENPRRVVQVWELEEDPQTKQRRYALLLTTLGPVS